MFLRKVVIFIQLCEAPLLSLGYLVSKVNISQIMTKVNGLHQKKTTKKTSNSIVKPAQGRRGMMLKAVANALNKGEKKKKTLTTQKELLGLRCIKNNM